MNRSSKLNVVTGAFGYIGRYITQELLAQGQQVRTITTHPDKPNPFGDQVAAFHYQFDDPAALTANLSGADCLFNTYYVRFEYDGATFDQAVANTQTLFRCAKEAGISKIVHIGVTNARLDDPLPYYRGKARQAEALRQLGLDYAILRPTLVFGVEDILVNNIAWLLRKFPIFPVFGDGNYRVQPIYVGEVARLAVAAAATDGNQEWDLVGPETFTFEDMVRRMASIVSPRTRFIHFPPRLGLVLGKLIGWLVGDVVLTWDELQGLMREKLTSEQAPRGSTAFSQWLVQHQEQLGTEYTSELARHFY